MEPENRTSGKGDSYWKPAFSGSMLNFGGVEVGVYRLPLPGYPGGHIPPSLGKRQQQPYEAAAAKALRLYGGAGNRVEIPVHG